MIKNMRANAAVWSLMAGAPALLLGVLGIAGRTQVQTWEFQEYGPSVHADVLAYRAVAPSPGMKPFYYQTEAELIDRARVWIDGARSGRLKDILPGNISDHGSNGVKGTLLIHRVELTSAMIAAGARAVRERRYEDAAQLGWRIAAVSDVGKYSGINCVVVSSSAQTRGLALIDQALPHLSPALRAGLARELSQVRHDEDSLEPLANRMNHLHVKRAMLEAGSISNMEAAAPYRGLATISLELASQTRVLSPREAPFGELSVELKGAIKAEGRFHVNFDHTMAALKRGSGSQI